MTFDARKFRDALGLFATGITVVTSIKNGDEPIGITVNSFSSVSLDPPLVLFSLALSGNHCQEFKETGVFAINVLGADQRHLCDRFASPLEDRFDGIDYTLGENGSPIFRDCPSIFECKIHATHVAGDHLIFVCKVTTVISEGKSSALLFHKGSFPIL